MALSLNIRPLSTQGFLSALHQRNRVDMLKKQTKERSYLQVDNLRCSLVFELRQYIVDEESIDLTYIQPVRILIAAS